MSIKTRIKSEIKYYMGHPNRNALFIFGFQKSGTSAIAGLLSGKTGKTVTIDTKYLWEPFQSQIISGDLKVKRQARLYSNDFSTDIIKEPSATFFIDQIKEYFYLNTFIFIVRNPFDNIRSILNRLELPGDLENIDLNEVNSNWRYIFSKDNGKNYIDVLAKRWLLANNQKDIIESPQCILVKYEEFNRDKEKYINDLAINSGFEPVHSISHLVNKQFQPKGNPNIDLIDFFGEKNYKKIQMNCSELMKYFGY